LRYVNASRQLAGKLGIPFIDLYDLMPVHWGVEPKLTPLTDNGIHPTAHGHRQIAMGIDQALGREWGSWRLNIDANGLTVDSRGASVSDVTRTDNGLTFTMLNHRLMPPPPPPNAPSDEAVGTWDLPVLSVHGLGAGNYTLKIDGRTVATATGDEWAGGVPIAGGPDAEQAEALRHLIDEKNRLFFHRWRAHNGEYIYGRRSQKFKHNAGNEQFPEEMAEIERLIGEYEEQVHATAVPAVHTYKIERAGESQ
jgi:hypothetical protein